MPSGYCALGCDTPGGHQRHALCKSGVEGFSDLMLITDPIKMFSESPPGEPAGVRRRFPDASVPPAPAGAGEGDGGGAGHPSAGGRIFLLLRSSV